MHKLMVSSKYEINNFTIQLELNVVAEGNNRKKNRITAYTEDKENILFVVAVMPQR